MSRDIGNIFQIENIFCALSMFESLITHWWKSLIYTADKWHVPTMRHPSYQHQEPLEQPLAARAQTACDKWICLCGLKCDMIGTMKSIEYWESSDNVFNIQPNFEASEQETFRIRLINLGSPLSYRLKIFQLVWHWHFYLAFEPNINRTRMAWIIILTRVYSSVCIST